MASSEFPLGRSAPYLYLVAIEDVKLRNVDGSDAKEPNKAPGAPWFLGSTVVCCVVVTACRIQKRPFCLLRIRSGFDVVSSCV